jgi:hypothetical protein
MSIFRVENEPRKEPACSCYPKGPRFIPKPRNNTNIVYHRDGRNDTNIVYHRDGRNDTNIVINKTFVTSMTTNYLIMLRIMGFWTLSMVRNCKY